MDYFVSQIIEPRIREYANRYVASVGGIVQPFAEPGYIRNLFTRRADAGKVGLVISDENPVQNGIIKPQTPIEFAREMKKIYNGNVELFLLTKREFILPELTDIVDRAMSFRLGEAHEIPQGLVLR